MAAMLEEQNNKSYLHKNKSFIRDGKEILLFSPPAWPLRTHASYSTVRDSR